MEPLPGVQQQLNASGTNLQNLAGELRLAELDAQKKRLVDSFYKEVSHTYGLCPAVRIDYSQFAIDGKTKGSLLLRRGGIPVPGCRHAGPKIRKQWHIIMRCGDHWGTLIIDGGYHGVSALRQWRHSRVQRKPSRKTLNPSI